jgi:hypothetical protein
MLLRYLILNNVTPYILLDTTNQNFNHKINHLFISLKIKRILSDMIWADQ